MFVELPALLELRHDDRDCQDEQQQERVNPALEHHKTVGVT